MNLHSSSPEESLAVQAAIVLYPIDDFSNALMDYTQSKGRQELVLKLSRALEALTKHTSNFDCSQKLEAVYTVAVKLGGYYPDMRSTMAKISNDTQRFLYRHRPQRKRSQAHSSTT